MATKVRMYHFRISGKRGSPMTFRRVIGSVAAATVLALAPTAAFAYDEPEEGFVQVSDTNPAPGEPVEVLVEAGVDASEATLEVVSEQDSIGDGAIEIAGAQSMTKAAVAGGATTFTVTLHEEGTYTATGTNDAGEVVGQATLVVGDGVPGDDAGAGDTDDDAAAAAGDDSAAGGSGLGATGAGAGTAILGGAGALLLVAGGALLFARRRKASLA